MNKRRMSALWSLLFVLLVLRGCGRSVPAASEQMSDASLLTKEERVERMLAQMTPAEKIGQMMIIGVHGTEMNDDIRFMTKAELKAKKKQDKIDAKFKKDMAKRGF